MPKVFATPNVAHITTGSEIVPPDAPLQPGKIRNTNATLIRALVEESLAAYVAHHHVDESLEAGLEICASPAIAKADVLLVSGGSSVGKHDRTADLLEALGFELVCRKVDCRPGKPLLLGIKGDQIAIGLPGNPVSHFVTFHLFVRRVLLLMAGHTPPRVVHAKLRSSETLESSERETYWPARYEVSRTDLVVSPQPWLDSGHLSALGKVNALIRLPGNQKLPVDDDLVEFIPCLNLTNSIL